MDKLGSLCVNLYDDKLCTQMCDMLLEHLFDTLQGASDYRMVMTVMDFLAPMYDAFQDISLAVMPSVYEGDRHEAIYNPLTQDVLTWIH